MEGVFDMILLVTIYFIPYLNVNSVGPDQMPISGCTLLYKTTFLAS